jgi:hypothetical protein
MAAPLMEGCEKLLDGLLLGPEITVKNGNVRDRTSALFRGELLDGRMSRDGMLDAPRPLVFTGIPTRAGQFGHGFTSYFRVYRGQGDNAFRTR